MTYRYLFYAKFSYDIDPWLVYSYERQSTHNSDLFGSIELNEEQFGILFQMGYEIVPF